MKKLVVILSIALAAVSCNDKKEGISTDLINNPVGNENAEMPIMTFDEIRIDFGTIREGDKVTKVFEFTNTGKAPLLISNVSATCGCTVPSNWPKDPVAPGDKGKIEVMFNSQGKPGQQTKQITILANTNPSENVVALAGEVERAGVTN